MRQVPGLWGLNGPALERRTLGLVPLLGLQKLFEWRQTGLAGDSFCLAGQLLWRRGLLHTMAGHVVGTDDGLGTLKLVFGHEKFLPRKT